MQAIPAYDCKRVRDDRLAALAALDVENVRVASIKLGDFDGMDGLRFLNLARNSLTALPAGVFRNLKKLEVLQLQGNLLAHLIPGALQELESLELLNLNDNRLTTLPVGAFRGLVRLRELLLHQNRLNTLPSRAFFGLGPDLWTLRMGGNLLADLPSGLFSELPGLEVLQIYDNRLETLPPDIFEGLIRLRELDLRGNHLAWLTEDDPRFEDLDRLVVLRLENQVEKPGVRNPVPPPPHARRDRQFIIPWMPAKADVYDNEGVVRIHNPNSRALLASITARDDHGRLGSSAAIALLVPAHATKSFSSSDLERGSGGLSGGLGTTAASGWWLRIIGDRDFEAYALMHNQSTGHRASLHGFAPQSRIAGQCADAADSDFCYAIPFFIAADETFGGQGGLLRILNPDQTEAALVNICGQDERNRWGRACQNGPVSFVLPSGQARMLKAGDLERGNVPAGLSGLLGDGEGNWRLTVRSDQAVLVQSLLQAGGFWANLTDAPQEESGLPVPPDAVALEPPDQAKR